MGLVPVGLGAIEHWGLMGSGGAMNEMHVMLVHGLGGSGPWHWQQWLTAQLPAYGVRAELPGLPGPDSPVLDEWLSMLRSRLASVPASAELVVAAHAEGVALWLHHTATIGGRARRADRVLLVAPPDPQREPDAGGLVPYPQDARSLRRAAGLTRLVVGTGDQHITMHGAHALADRLKIELDVVLDGEHVDTEAGYGPWPSVLRWALYGSTPLLDRLDGEPHTAGYSLERLRLA